MKAVLISIKPKWTELIASGKKTVEVRKTKPKIDVPFKCYIYETQGRTETPFVDEEGHHIFKGRGQVIGEFLCEKIDVYTYDCHIGYPTPQYEGDDSFCDCGEGYWITYKEIEDSCLTQDELMDYGRGDTLFGWHISNLVIYEKPKELSEFKRVCDGNCQTCKYAVWQTNGCAYEPYIVDCQPITRPPQSWCYVEELKGETE